MKFLRQILCRYVLGDTAATAMEYALIAGGVAVAISVIVYTLGDNVEAIFTFLSGVFSDAGF